MEKFNLRLELGVTSIRGVLLFEKEFVLKLDLIIFSGVTRRFSGSDAQGLFTEDNSRQQRQFRKLAITYNPEIFDVTSI
jgi:hypothetical protein